MKLGEMDFITLDLNGTVVQRLDAPAAADEADAPEDDEDEVAGPLAIAVDMADADEATAPASDNPAL